MRFRLLLVCLGLAASGSAFAEPYFAVQQGLKCMACHVNPAGGGMRNTFGEVWGQTMLPARRIATEPDEPWSGELSRFVAIGGNLRATGSVTDTPHQSSVSAFDTEELRVYLDLRVIPDRLSVYVDQRLAPGGSTNAEAYGRFWFADRHWYVQAGQMFLPYGLRLQDDTAFIRQVPGINFATPDRGVAIGLETTQWSAQFAVSNGTAGGPATDQGKQYSLRAEHVQARWRAGASLNINDAADGERDMSNVFAGLRTGPVAWLAEADYIIDDSFSPKRKQSAGLIEADWTIRKGQNLKLTAEYFDPDTDIGHDQQDRFSLVWEYTPIQFAQIRLGVRNYDGIPQNDLQNRRFIFAQLNGYF
jgi:hypothetical protein